MRETMVFNVYHQLPVQGFPSEFSILKFSHKKCHPITWPPCQKVGRLLFPCAYPYPNFEWFRSIWSCVISIQFISSSIIIITYRNSTERVAHHTQPVDRFLPSNQSLPIPRAAPRLPQRGPVSPATLPLTSPQRSPSVISSAGRPSCSNWGKKRLLRGKKNPLFLGFPICYIIRLFFKKQLLTQWDNLPREDQTWSWYQWLVTGA